MHCARWVISCLSPLFMEERSNYVYLSAILSDYNDERSLAYLMECKVTLPYRSFHVFLYLQPKTEKKNCCHK